jgi:hypothetical protein
MDAPIPGHNNPQGFANAMRLEDFFISSVPQNKVTIAPA